MANVAAPSSPGNSSSSRVDIVKQYNKVAYAYTTSVMCEPLWTHTTSYSITNYITKGRPDTLKGASVLDLGCGCGAYSRLAAGQGASRIVGLDISPEQIALAQEFERRDPAFGTKKPSSVIQFMVRDASSLTKAEELGQFDVVLAVHLLCSCQNRDEMRSMLVSISSRLKKGGRLVGVCECLDTKSKGQAPRRVFGELKGGPMFSYEMIPSGKDKQCLDFCRCDFSFRNSDQSSYSLTTFPVREGTLREMLVDTGFQVDSIGPQLTCSPEGRGLFPSDLLNTLIEEYGAAMCYFDATKK